MKNIFMPVVCMWILPVISGQIRLFPSYQQHLSEVTSRSPGSKIQQDLNILNKIQVIPGYNHSNYSNFKPFNQMKNLSEVSAIPNQQNLGPTKETLQKPTLGSKIIKVKDNTKIFHQLKDIKDYPNTFNEKVAETQISTLNPNQLLERSYLTYDPSSEIFAGEKSSYTSYSSNDNNIVPYNDYSQYYAGNTHHPQTFTQLDQLLERQATEEQIEFKEKYYYHKAKFISTLVGSIFAFGLSMIFISIGTTTFIANANNGRRKRDVDGNLDGRQNFADSIACVSRFMCELDQSGTLFGYHPEYEEPSRTLEGVHEEQSFPAEQQRQQHVTQGTSKRVKRRSSELPKRNCEEILENCPLNFPMIFSVWKIMKLVL